MICGINPKNGTIPMEYLFFCLERGLFLWIVIPVGITYHLHRGINNIFQKKKKKISKPLNLFFIRKKWVFGNFGSIPIRTHILLPNWGITINIQFHFYLFLVITIRPIQTRDIVEDKDKQDIVKDEDKEDKHQVSIEEYSQ